MDNRMGLAQAMAGGAQGSPPPEGPRQMQAPEDPLQQILAIVMKISDQLDALTQQETQEPPAQAPMQAGPPQQ